MTVRVRHRLAPLVLLTLLSTACGSTVANSGTAASAPAGGTLNGPTANGSDGGAGTGLQPGGTTGTVTGPGGTQPGAGSTSGGATGAGTSGPSGGTAGGSTTTGSVASGPGSGPGVTAKQIYVGLIYDENAGAVNQAAGMGSITSGNSKANSQAIINDINKHGGVGGRKLVPVYARFDSTSSQTLDQQYAAICSQFTQDSPRVFAVLGVGTDSYRRCITKAGVSILDDDLPALAKADLDRYPSLIEQGYPNVDRLAAYTVQPLVEQKYFTPWDAVNGQPAAAGKAKIGIYTYDDKVFAPAVDRYLVPALKRLGYDPQVAKIAQVNTASDYGSQSAAVKSAQLSFAANGVTHVISFEGNGGLSVFFLANARSQHYYPRYGISSSSGFQALLDTGAYDKQQMNGALGFGWIPSVDLPATMNPDNGPYSNVNRRYCLKVMKDNGISFTSTNAETIALAECASLYLLKVAVDKNPQVVAANTFMTTVESLGASYQAAGSLGQTFARGRHDPTDKAYHWRYYNDCGCFHYEGSLHTIP